MTLTAEIERAEKVLNKALDEEKVLNFALEGLPNLQNRMQAPNNALQQIDQGDAAALLMNQNESNITSIAGVIKADEYDRLQRLIFRTTKGKSITENKIIEGAQANNKEETRCAYIIMFWDGAMQRERIQKICDSFSGDRFDVPQNQMQINEAIRQVKGKIDDARRLVKDTRRGLRTQLLDFDRVQGQDDNSASTMYIFKMFLAREKAMFRTLN